MKIDSIRTPLALVHITSEIEAAHQGWQLEKALSPDAEHIDLYLESQDSFTILRIDFGHATSSLYLLSQPPKHPEGRPVFKSIWGKELMAASAIRDDRKALLDFGKQKLLLHLFGKGGSGAYLFSRDAEAYEQHGRQHEELELPKPSSLASSIELDDFADNYHVSESKKEILLHIGEQPNEYFKSFPAPSRAVEYIVSRYSYLEAYSQLHSYISSLVTKKKRKLSSKLARFRDWEPLMLKGEEQRLWADILMARPDIKEKKDRLQTKDWEGKPLDIKLDEKLTLLENAQKLYEKSKTLERTIEEQQDMIPDIEKELKSTNEIELILESRPRYKELEKLQKEHRWLRGQSYTKAKKEDKFRRFQLGEGALLFVGKSAANNDELTGAFAKPNDIWLHAKDVSGSHAIIRSGGGEIAKYLIEKAARIAAYYSSARNQSYVPVIFTPKKYVRKKKGAAPGAVVVTKEEVVFVEPGLE